MVEESDNVCMSVACFQPCRYMLNAHIQHSGPEGVSRYVNLWEATPSTMVSGASLHTKFLAATALFATALFWRKVAQVGLPLNTSGSKRRKVTGPRPPENNYLWDILGYYHPAP